MHGTKLRRHISRHVKEAESAFARDERQRPSIGDLEPELALHVPLRYAGVRGHAVSDCGDADDSATLQFFEGRNVDDGAAAVAERIYGVLVLSARHPLAGMDQHAATEARRPGPILDVLVAGVDGGIKHNV